MFCAAAALAVGAEPGLNVSLDGTWDCGLARQYSHVVRIPGLAGDPGQPTAGTIWFRRVVELPEGNWRAATLVLKGARFAPQVYVNGALAGTAPGGMAPIEFALPPETVGPGKVIVLEIALKSLRDLDPHDASAVPEADRWRTEVSSELWDGVSLHLAGAARLSHVVTLSEWARRRVEVRWDATGLTGRVEAAVSGEGFEGARGEGDASAGHATVDLPPECPEWTPEAPRLLQLAVTLRDHGMVQDQVVRRWAWRDFRVDGTGLRLNGAPVTLRGASVVWHRWLRDPDAATVAFDPAWFEANIVRRLKGYGANFLRFHLGLPPEALLDLCDRDGLLVQVEWPFFHGISAAPDSLRSQWRSWLETAARHPSVVVVQPWNETTGPEVAPAWRAFDAAAAGLPPFVVTHRDVLTVHRYWWSLFENLGLYYDSAAAFGRPVLADEFGGNYLDADGLPGRYPAVRESLLRFLGRDQTGDQRLAFQAQANARVAEYWRRIGAAGIVPFCALSSPEDGNTWFLGPIAEGRPKPVWDALAAAYAPVSASLDLWDRNFPLRGALRAPVMFFNETDYPRHVQATLRVRPRSAGPAVAEQKLTVDLPAHSRAVRQVELGLPGTAGDWQVQAEVPADEGNPHRVISQWDVRTLSAEAPAALATCSIGVPDEETELRALIERHGLPLTTIDDDGARVLVFGRKTWEKGRRDGAELSARLAKAIAAGQSVVWLDVGPGDLGPGYGPAGPGPLEAPPDAPKRESEVFDLPGGVRMRFAPAAEPESHVHPTSDGQTLWHHLPRDATWLWNGLRGGLIVPAETMTVSGLNPGAYYRLWSSRGAFPLFIRTGPYYAYALEGYHTYSRSPHDADAMARLREKVRQAAADAPGLPLNPGAPIEEIDLAAEYRNAPAQGASGVAPLVEAGKGLARTPVVAIGYGTGRGVLVVSQLLTAGRTRPGVGEPGPYGRRFDPAAEQMVLNLVGFALDGFAPNTR